MFPPTRVHLALMWCFKAFVYFWSICKGVNTVHTLYQKQLFFFFFTFSSSFKNTDVSPKSI